MEIFYTKVSQLKVQDVGGVVENEIVSGQSFMNQMRQSQNESGSSTAGARTKRSQWTIGQIISRTSIALRQLPTVFALGAIASQTASLSVIIKHLLDKAESIIEK